MKDAIALALIKQLVAIGQIDADDVSEICIHLSDKDAHAVKAAWVEGIAGPDAKPVLRVVD